MRGLALTIGLLIVLGACSHAPSEAERWNVLLVTLDTTRADALGCYGAKGSPTPELDRIAAEGTRFDEAISTAALTPVSHAAILTGLENREHGVRVMAGPGGYELMPGVPTLATILRAKGYRTVAVQSSFTVSSWFGFDRGFDVFDGFDGSFKPGPAGNLTWDQGTLQRRSDETVDRAMAQVSGKEPFFLWVHLWDPHDEVRVPPAEFLPAGLPRDGEGRFVPCRALYAAEVRYMDHELGRLVDALKSGGKWDHTMVVVVGDHGEGLGDHGWASHRILYQEEIRVPLLVRVPGRKRVHEVPALVRTTDIAPTVLDWLGVEAPRAMSGRSLRALIDGKEDASRVAFADALNGYDLNVKSLEARPFEDFVYVVIEMPWKLMYRPLHPEMNELFDLERDPKELENRFKSEPGQVLKLEKLLARGAPWVAGPFPPSAKSGVAVDRARKMFADLGYVAGGMPGADARFAFVCPEHPSEVHDTPQRCVQCGGQPILVARSK